MSECTNFFDCDFPHSAALWICCPLTDGVWDDGSLPAHSKRLREICFALVSMAVLVPLGFYFKRASTGGVFYVIFWCMAVSIVLPRTRAWRIAAGVVVATCILEFLQLWHPRFLEEARSHFVGRTILGSYFDWGDFLYYFVGGPVGWLWLRALGRR